MEQPTDPVSMLKAFAREQGGDGLEVSYPNLRDVAAEALKKAPVLLEDFWQADEGSIAEEDRARKAAVGYFILTGLRLNETSHHFRGQVAERFTQSSIELYGQPEETEFQNLLIGRINELQELVGNETVDQDRLTRVLATLSSRRSGEHLYINEADTLIGPARELAEALSGRYGDALAVFDGRETYNQARSFEAFDRAVSVLKQKDPRWSDWKVLPHEKRAYETSKERQELLVGRTAHDGQKLAQLFCHEALTHALRAINGRSSDVPMLERGLPGYLDAEEGLAVIFEYGISGKLPDIRLDRYVDFGLALGLGGRPGLNRKQLHAHFVDRSIIRKQRYGGGGGGGEAIDPVAIDSDAWHYVNRIFRGSPNIDEIAVNTKDLAYTTGFLKVGRYVGQCLSGGISADELLDYLLVGSFDPTNQRHQEHLRSYGLEPLAI